MVKRIFAFLKKNPMLVLVAVVAVLTVVAPQAAHATLSSTDAFYKVWTTFTNLINGAIGAVGAGVLLLLGIVSLYQGYMVRGVIAVLCATAIFIIPTIAQNLVGALF